MTISTTNHIEITNGKYVGYISEAIHASSTEETIDVEANLLFLYFIESLNTKNIKITISKEEIKGISILVNKFVDNKSLCLKALKTISFNFIDTKGKKCIYQFIPPFYSILLFRFSSNHVRRAYYD